MSEARRANPVDESRAVRSALVSDTPSHHPSASDGALIRRAATDPDAFRELYLQHRDFVYRIARRYSASNEDALDAAQDTFIYLLRKLPTLKLTGKLTTYLYPIARNTALARARAASRARGGIALPPPPASVPPSAPDSHLAAALAELSDELREVVIMRLIEDMSVEEVATALDIPTGTVKSRLHNALAALRNNPRLKDLMP
jgi:RNA polymerase sigma-70 factor (ECF subfamily)